MQKSQLARFFNDDIVTPEEPYKANRRRIQRRAELRAKRPPVFVYNKGRWVHENKVDGNIFQWRKQAERDRLNELAENQAEMRKIMMHARGKRTPKQNKKETNKGTKKSSQSPSKNTQKDLVRNIMKNLPKNSDRERISNTYALMYKLAPSRAHRLAVIEEVKNKLKDNRLSLANRQNLWQLVRQENAKGHLGLYNRMKQDTSLYKNGKWVKKQTKPNKK